MKKILLLIFMIAMISFDIHTQIHSTFSGGYWNDRNTWVGGIIPGNSNDVIIEGPVILASTSGYTILTEYCNNLTITEGGSLKNGDYGGGSGIYPLEVSGNVINNGTVANGPSDLLKIYISGDLENNNIWMPYMTEFRTSLNHNLSLKTGKSFGSRIVNNGATSITALSDMLFTCDFMADGNYNRENFYLNGQTFNIGSHSIELRKCLINSGTLTGDFQINGNFKVDMNPSDTLVFAGNIVVKDTLTCNEYGGGSAIEKLKIIGNITNNGVVMDNDGGNPDDLSLLVTGNIINNGEWTCNYVNLIGTGTQYLSQSAGKIFDSYFIDFNPGSKVQALSDISIKKDFNLNGSTLEMGNQKLTIKGWLYNGYINNTKLHNGFLRNLTSINNLIIEGLVTVENNVIFENSVVVNDTLQNSEYGDGSVVYNLTIDGSIQNNGVIRSYSNDDELSISIAGNIINDGIWTCNSIKLTGSNTQFITQRPGKKFESNFYDQDKNSEVQALSDITITKDFNLNGSTLQIESHTLTINGWLYNGIINNTRLHNGFLQNLTSLNNLIIEGLVTVDSNNLFQNSVIVNDTLQNNEYGGGSITYTLKIKGNIQNNGVIKNNSLDDQLSVEVTGNIENNGKWGSGFTKFTGTTAQQISSLDGHVLEGEFFDLDSTSSVVANSNLTFSGNINLGRAILDMQNKELTLKRDKWISNGYLKNTKLKNGLLSGLRLLEDIEINGKVEIENNVDAVGSIIVNDTLCAASYSGGSAIYNFNLWGNILNNGLVGQIYDDVLAFKINGNITNKGIWNAFRNYFLFYTNKNFCSLSYVNTGTSDIQINGSTITGSGADAFSISSGGGTKTILKDQSYDITIKSSTTGNDNTANLNLDCGQLGSLNNLTLINSIYPSINTDVKAISFFTNNPGLNQNYPNPFNRSTRIRWHSSVSGWKTLKIFDVYGREIVILMNEYKPAGDYEVEFNSKTLPAGIYLYQLIEENSVKNSGQYTIQIRKMLLIK